MDTTKVQVDYNHNPADHSTIYLAVSSSAQPGKNTWKPAYRDTVNGKRVVWARFPSTGRTLSVWLRDRDGDRRVTQMQV